jgi:hypothetical protein
MKSWEFPPRKRADAQVPKKDPGPKRTLTRQQFTQQAALFMKG